jgi:uncharacterized 2Fe-2S/4Fe-4S cluster protein (DUF4445 family)
MVGNPTMLHILLGIDPAPLGVFPYEPAFRKARTLPAQEIGLGPWGRAPVHVLPLVSGYIGADTVAGLLATALHRSDTADFLMDVGTNGELVLSCGGHLRACSCAAGPALEGMSISCGMRAGPGAVARVRFGDDVELEVIGGGEARGICGSGILDGVAELRRSGLLDTAGRLTRSGGPLPPDLPPALADRLFNIDGRGAFRLAGELVVTQQDIRQIQLAKGALAAGARILLDRSGCDESEVGTLWLAGAFGSELTPSSLSRLGLVAAGLADRIRPAGNAALWGARRYLIAHELREEAAELARRIEPLDLAAEPGYAEIFLEALAFPD